MVVLPTSEERAGSGDALFLWNTKWLQLFAQEIFTLASLGTGMSEAQSTDYCPRYLISFPDNFFSPYTEFCTATLHCTEVNDLPI